MGVLEGKELRQAEEEESSRNKDNYREQSRLQEMVGCLGII